MNHQKNIAISITNHLRSIGNEDEEIALLRKVDAFRKLCSEDLKLIFNSCTEKSFSAHEEIFKVSSESNKLYILISGSVKLFNYNLQGGGVIKSILYPNEIFGESSIYLNSTRSFYAIAKQEVNLFEIDQANLRRLVDNIAGFESIILNSLIRRMQAELKLMDTIVNGYSKTRIINFIKETANKIGKKIGYEVLVNHGLTHLEISQATYTSRQTVTTVFNELKDSNQIFYERGKILIRDLSKL